MELINNFLLAEIKYLSSKVPRKNNAEQLIMKNKLFF